MSNNILTLQEIARLALSTLNEYLLFPHLCYRDFSDSPAELGDVAEIRMPAVLTAQDFDATNGVSYQDLTNDTTIDVELNHLATVDVRVPAGYDSLTLDELNQVLIKPAAEALAKKINTDGMKLCMEIANTVGTPGVTPSSLSDIIATRTTMTEKGIPIEDRVGIWNPDADVLFNQLSALSQPETDDAGKYALGRVCGIDNYMSPDVPQHTVGTAISNNAALMLSVAAKQGDTKFSITGGTDKTLKRGDILLINNVHYVVAEDIQFVNSDAIVPILGAAKRNHSIGTSVYYKGSKDVPIYVCNMAFHPMAFAYVTRPLSQGNNSYVISQDGFSLRVTKGYDQDQKCSAYSIDVLYGLKTVQADLALRVLG